MPALLSLDAISKSFGATPAVNDVSLTVDKGEILALIGPSGCGKTTTLRIIAGFETPDTGTIRLAGRDVTALPPERRGIGMVFQDYALFPHKTVGENILFGARDPGALGRLLDMVGLAGLAGRYPDELSGGQQQRVALARSFAAEPDFLLLDEPFSNLDPLLRGATRREIRQMLKASGLGIVVVTHDQEEALSFADRVAVMHQGRVLQAGPAQQVYDLPATPFVARFLGRTNLIDGVADGAHCATVFGRLELARPATGRVRLSLRPEALALQPADTPDAGRVTGVEFKGHDMTYWVDWQGAEWQVDALAGPRLSEGARVRIEVRGRPVPLMPDAA